MSYLRTMLVDDIREITSDVVARTYARAVELADADDMSTVLLYLDHDLGEEKTGYDFINHLIATDNLPAEVYIVSSNPVGRDNIGRALVHEGFRKDSPSLYVSGA